MAELTASERLQPALLDRLRDDEPGATQESRERRVMSMRRLRECVVRDLGWLLNTESHMPERLGIGQRPAVGASVLNFGLPPIAGRNLTHAQVPELERTLRDAIVNFEPRLLPSSLRVKVLLDGEAASTRALTFEITAALWAQPTPEQLYLKTRLDLETGDVSIDTA